MGRDASNGGSPRIVSFDDLDVFGLAVTTPDGRFITTNENLCAIVGRTRSELLSTTYAAVVHADDYGQEREQLVRMLAGEVSHYVLEERYVRPHGELRWVVVRASLVGEDPRVVRRTLDVTERRRAQSERELIFDRAPDLIAVAGLDGSVHQVNQAHTRVLGWSAEELQGHGWQTIVHPDDLAELPARMAMLASGQVLDMELRARSRDGRYRWLSVRVMPDLANQRIYGYGRDVTERKETEAALARSREQTERIFDESPIGMAISNAELRFVRVNAAFSEMLGATEDELVGRGVAEVTHPEDADVQTALARRLLAGGIPSYDIEKRYIRPDGETLWARLRATAIEFGPRNLLHHLAMVEDISEIRAAEALRREYDELKDAFLRVASHDLRGPLANIAGLADILGSPESGLDAEAQRDGVRRIGAQAHRLHHIVDTFLDFDRLYHDSEHATRQPTDLVSLVRRVVAAVDLGDRPVVIEAESPLSAVDPDQVERILENLLANAAVHTPPGTPVWVRATAADMVSLVVEDAGPGVPDTLKGRIFELFRAFDLEGRRGGTGLWVVNRLAELHGGRAWVEDRPGGGASFQVLLPAAGAVDELRLGDADPRCAISGT